jgi:DNA-directed RNA polymerase specialized sigma24 family protein
MPLPPKEKQMAKKNAPDGIKDTITVHAPDKRATQQAVATTDQSVPGPLLGPSTVELYDTHYVDELLERYDLYICALAKKNIGAMRKYIHPDLLEIEVNELAQRSRIKFWQALRQQAISNPKAYIHRIVHNEAVSMLRQKLRTVPLSLNEDGEVYQGQVLVGQSEGMDNPALETELLEMTASYMAQVAHAVAKLPSRQQKAIICSLKDRLDNVLPFIDTCQELGINPNVIVWPADRDDLYRLKASISSARRHMRVLMKEANSPPCAG